MTLRLFIEPGDTMANEADVTAAVEKEIKRLDNSFVVTHGDVGSYLDFGVEVTLLPKGTFANYTAQRQAEGADLAHLKPPHINPSKKVLSLLLGEPEAGALASV